MAFLSLILMVLWSNEIPEGTQIVSNKSSPMKITYPSDYGKVNHGEYKEMAIDCENISNHDLRITDIVTNCSCTRSTSIGTIIKSQSKGKIHLRFNSFNKKGRQRIPVTISYECDRRSYHADILLVVTVENSNSGDPIPNELYLGMSDAGSKREVSKTLRFDIDSITSIKVPTWIQYKLKKKDNQSCTLELQLEIPKTMGLLDEKIEIYTANKTSPSSVIQVLTYVNSSYNIVPKTVVKLVGTPSDYTQKLSINHKDNLPIKYLGYSLESHEKVSVQVEKSTQSTEKRIDLTFVVDEKVNGKGTIKFSLLIKVEADNVTEEIRVPCIFIAR